MTRHRFRAVEDGAFCGSKVLSREEVAPGKEARSPGAFLGRLWALLGPAAPMDGGFRYVVLDQESGLRFSAYSGASGPSYGAMVSRDEIASVVRAFEEVLGATPPADCALAVPREIEYGGGHVRIGVRGGAPFEEPVPEAKKRRSPKAARTYEDCLAIATETGKGYGLAAGWLLCLQKVVPDPPESFALDDKEYENCVGFTLSSKKAPVFAFDEGDGLVEIPVGRIPWRRPLPAAAALWLGSYEAWRAAKRGAAKR